MSAPSPCMIANLPEELLLLVFRCLCEVGPAWETEGQPERNPWLVKQLPFRHMDKETQPHAGLRGELAARVRQQARHICISAWQFSGVQPCAQVSARR